MDVTWTSTEDSLPTVHTLPEDGFFPEVGCPETKTDADTRPIVGRYIDRLSTVDRYIASTNSKHVPFFLLVTVIRTTHPIYHKIPV